MAECKTKLKRGRPNLALGGGARKDHLFNQKTALCQKYLYGGGYEIDPEDIDYEDEADELCKKCAKKAGIL